MILGQAMLLSKLQPERNNDWVLPLQEKSRLTREAGDVNLVCDKLSHVGNYKWLVGSRRKGIQLSHLALLLPPLSTDVVVC